MLLCGCPLALGYFVAYSIGLSTGLCERDLDKKSATRSISLSLVTCISLIEPQKLIPCCCLLTPGPPASLRTHRYENDRCGSNRHEEDQINIGHHYYVKTHVHYYYFAHFRMLPFLIFEVCKYIFDVCTSHYFVEGVQQ